MDLNEELSQYVHEHSLEEEDILKELYRQTHANIYHPRMVSGHLQGKILYMICKMIQPKNVLEIGTFTGYSAISMAFALENNSKITTIDNNDEIEDFTRQFIKKAKVEDKIDFKVGNALDIIPELKTEFDLVFIDGEKREYIDYYKLAIPKLKQGGFIIADNVLWGGKVIEKKLRANDYDTHGIIEFNKFIKNDSKVENVMLPIRDGLMLIRKK